MPAHELVAGRLHRGRQTQGRRARRRSHRNALEHRACRAERRARRGSPRLKNESKGCPALAGCRRGCDQARPRTRLRADLGRQTQGGVLDDAHRNALEHARGAERRARRGSPAEERVEGVPPATGARAPVAFRRSRAVDDTRCSTIRALGSRRAAPSEHESMRSGEPLVRLPLDLLTSCRLSRRRFYQ